jgi:hypothetical protein
MSFAINSTLISSETKIHLEETMPTSTRNSAPNYIKAKSKIIYTPSPESHDIGRKIEMDFSPVP